MIVGGGTCARQVLRSGIDAGALLLGISGIRWIGSGPPDLRIDRLHLRTQGDVLSQFAGRRVFAGGDISPSTPRKALRIPPDDLEQVLTNVPINHIARHSLQKACEDAGLIPTSLHEALSSDPELPEYLPAVIRDRDLDRRTATGGNRQAARAVLTAICESRSDTRLKARPMPAGEVLAACLSSARSEEFDTAFIDAALVRECARAGFSRIILDADVLVLEPSRVEGSCRRHKVVLVRR